MTDIHIPNELPKDISELRKIKSRLINYRERKEFELQEINIALSRITDLIIYLEKTKEN